PATDTAVHHLYRVYRGELPSYRLRRGEAIPQHGRPAIVAFLVGDIVGDAGRTEAGDAKRSRAAFDRQVSSEMPDGIEAQRLLERVEAVRPEGVRQSLVLLDHAVLAIRKSEKRMRDHMILIPAELERDEI